MINIERAVTEKFPVFANQPPIIRKPTIKVLQKLAREYELNRFLSEHAGIEGFDFIEAVFEYFNFSYSVSNKSRANIPAQGRVVIVANHPLGSLDGLALLKLVGEIRRDVRIVANDMLMSIQPLSNLFIPLDNMTRETFRLSYQRVLGALQQEQAIIVFPAGEVSRAKPTGIKDGKWHTGFLHFARKTSAPVLPIHVHGKNSALFYGVSMLAKPLSTAMLAGEMFKQRNRILHFSVGQAIPAEALRSEQVTDKAIAKRVKKHLYKIGKARKPLKKTDFVTEKTIAHPEDSTVIKTELDNARLIGSTTDSNRIFLYDYCPDGSIMREIGRLRELAFRQVGEGSGERRDVDKYDQYYRHLVLWDERNLTIAGAYRLGNCIHILKSRGLPALYTADLFNYTGNATAYLKQALELGRSFVNPQYWGKTSLDYLWQGIGAYLKHHPEIRYVIGPVSLSDDYPQFLRDALVYYYEKYFRHDELLATAKRPYYPDPQHRKQLIELFADEDIDSGFSRLQKLFKEQGHKIPVLYKQYASLYEPGGYRLLSFSTDPDFGNCVDGLFIGDLTMLKPAKRARYIK